MTILARCEKCDGRFQPATGGICTSCGRLLCGWHLHGVLGWFARPFRSAKPRCGDCRKRAQPVRVGTWFLLVFLIGCTHALPLGMDQDVSPSIRTDKEEYTTRRTAQFLETEIGMEYTNRTGRAVYVPTCHGVNPPGLEKRVGGQWVRAYSPTVLRCLGPPLVVQPGGSYTYTLRVSAGLPGNNYYPKFEVAEIKGTYRLVWTIYRTWEPNGPGPDLGELLPLDQRVSNEFRITD